MTPPRSVDVARLGLGLLALARPRLLLRLAPGDDETRVRRAVRLLGLRYVVQAAGGTAVRRSWVPAADAAVDLVHAASMLALAGVAPRHRRLALSSATAAVVFATADLRPEGRTHPERSRP